MNNQSTIGMVVFFGVALPICLICNLLFWRMVGEVNSKLPKGERFDFVWLYPGKLTKLERLHKQFFPNSRLRFYANTATVVFLAAFAFFAYLVSQQ